MRRPPPHRHSTMWQSCADVGPRQLCRLNSSFALQISGLPTPASHGNHAIAGDDRRLRSIIGCAGFLFDQHQHIEAAAMHRRRRRASTPQLAPFGLQLSEIFRRSCFLAGNIAAAPVSSVTDFQGSFCTAPATSFMAFGKWLTHQPRIVET